MSEHPSHTTVSPAPSQCVDETEANTAQDATTNNPQSKTIPTENGDASCRAVGESDEKMPEQADKEGLPEQKHAGAVGYGPNYAIKNRATLGDKITGIKEQVVGRVTNNPELVQKGNDRKAGELKRKDQEELEANPIATNENQDPPSPPGATARSSIRTDTNNSETRGSKSALGRRNLTNNDLIDL